LAQWCKIESPKINPHTYRQFSIKEARIYKGEKNISASGAWRAGQCM